MEMPHPPKPETEAGAASPEQGVVVLDGPDGVAVAMLPDPAEATGRSLIEAATEARKQTDDDRS